MQPASEMIMKRIIISLMMALGLVLSAWAGAPEKIGNIARQYSSHQGFEVVKMGRLLLGALRTAARLDGDMDEEDRAALDAFCGIKHLTVVDFEEASETDRVAFCRKIEKELTRMELIMEAKDSSETLRIYGIDDGKNLRDIVLYSPNGALITMSGSIAMEHIGRLMEVTQ